MIQFPIQGYCRIKPPSDEVSQIPYKILENEIHIENQAFLFDAIFPPAARNSEIFTQVLQPLVNHIFNGINATLLAYGQTGGGKTYTMSAMINKTLQHVIARSEGQNEVYLSYLQLYSEKCHDLLNDNNPVTIPKEQNNYSFGQIHSGTEEKIQTKNLLFRKLPSLREAAHYIAMANENKKTSVTKMNAQSSRSHTICTIYIGNGTRIPEVNLHLVDLAGSEQYMSLSDNYLMRNEAKKINLSLHYLEQVMIALDEPQRVHIPYRNSQLTSILRDSLGGSSVTSLIAVVSMDTRNKNQTLATLKFAQRSLRISNYLPDGITIRATDLCNDFEPKHPPVINVHRNFTKVRNNKKIEKLENKVKLRDKEISILLEMLIEQEMGKSNVYEQNKMNNYEHISFTDIDKIFQDIGSDNFILNNFKTILSTDDTSNSNSSAVLRTFAVDQTKSVIKNNYPRTLSKSNNKSRTEINTTSRRFEPCNTNVEKLPILKEKQEENLIRDQTDNGKYKEHKEKEQPNVDTIEDVTDPSIVQSRDQTNRGTTSFHEKYGRKTCNTNDVLDSRQKIIQSDYSFTVKGSFMSAYDKKRSLQGKDDNSRVNEEIEKHTQPNIAGMSEHPVKQKRVHFEMESYDGGENIKTRIKDDQRYANNETKMKTLEKNGITNIGRKLTHKERRRSKETDNGKHKEHKRKEQPNLDIIEDVTDPSIVKNIAQYLTGDEVIDQEIIKFYARRGIVVNTGSF